MKKRILLGLSTAVLISVAVAGAVAQQQQQQSQVGGAAQAPATPPPAEEQAALQNILQTSDPQQRVALVEEFLAKYPDSLLRMPVYAAGAEAYQVQRNFEKAIEYGERALELNPRYAGALLLVADSLALSAVPTQLDYQQRLTRAENYVQQALEVLPDMLATMPRRPETPEEEFDRQRKYFEAQPHAILGFVYLRRNENGKAEEELKLATDLNQWRPDPVDFQRLGYAHLRQKEYAEAESAFRRCVELGGPAGSDCQRRADQAQQMLKTQAPPEAPKPQE